MRVSYQGVSPWFASATEKREVAVQNSQKNHLTGLSTDQFQKNHRAASQSNAPTKHSPVLFGNTHPKHWQYGAHVVNNKVRFKVWAPRAEKAELLLMDPLKAIDVPLQQRIREAIPMTPDRSGRSFYLEKADLPMDQKNLYMFRIYYSDGSISKPLPDPRSRYQPEDVHGPSQIVPQDNYQWQAQGWKIPQDKRQLSIYKLHIGTFTPEGTLNSAIKKLDYLKETGYNAIEVLPVKEFAGNRNWGYDMVDYFAIENAYGKPEDFKRFVDEAHKRGIAVLLDVVYNHVGPEGNYFREFDRQFLDPVSGEWGDRFNWHNPQAEKFVLDNLEMWVKEYRVDGFRFDMSSRIPDEMLKKMVHHIQNINPDVILTAEDDRASNHVTMPQKNGGIGMWAKWNFDVHHRTKSAITGQSHMGAPTDITSLSWIIEEGFPGPHNKMNSLHDSINYFESHDEVGNHDGFRTNLKIPRNRFMLGSIMKYVIPGIPMTFMGEEYAEKSPFYFFANYTDPVCIQGTREGRKNNPQPDCFNVNNFLQSRLSWQKDPGVYRLNQDMLRLKKEIPALWEGDQREMAVDRSYLGSNVLVLHRRGREHPDDEVLIVANMSGYDYQNNYKIRFPKGLWEEVLNTDNARYGGGNLINAGKPFWGEQEVSLPGWSLSIYRKKPGDYNNPRLARFLFRKP